MNKENKIIIKTATIEFILIHVVYCICKLFLFDCELLNLFINIAIGLSLIVSVIITFYHFKKKDKLFFVIEPIFLFLLLFIYVFINAPGINYFTNKCDSGWFSGINYAAFIVYFIGGRIILWIIGIVSHIIYSDNKSQSYN